jgi:hypothetical protein
VVAGWSAAGARQAALPWRPARVVRRDGSEEPPPASDRARLDGAVRYFHRPS